MIHESKRAGGEPNRVNDFTEFATEAGPRLKVALCAGFGEDLGVEATAEALAFAWENWDRIREKSNPAGYVFGVGRNTARKRLRRRHPILPAVPHGHVPWIEPGLPAALASLPERQRLAVMLVHSFEWTLSEVAELMGVSKATVQTHIDRGMGKLRKKIGVSS